MEESISACIGYSANKNITLEISSPESFVNKALIDFGISTYQ